MAVEVEKLPMRVIATAAAVFGLIIPTSATAEPTQEPYRIVYWGNTQTGQTVRIFNKVDAEAKAEAQVKALGGAGWVLLENSTTPGFGAAICRLSGGVWSFYTAHGYATGKEAVTAAKAKANGGGSFCSNALWRVSDAPTPQASSLIDEVKGAVRKAATHSKEDYERECVKPELPQTAQAELRPIGNGTAPLKDQQPSTTSKEWKPAPWCPKYMQYPATVGIRN